MPNSSSAYRSNGQGISVRSCPGQEDTMAHRRISKVDASAALAAALIIGIQAVLMSLSLGVHAAPGPRDAFGGSICVFSGNAGDSGHKGNHHSLPDCCSSGCALASGSPPPASALLILPEMAAEVAFLLPQPVLRPETERSSIRARAPPSLG
jgi:hypothetical protein